MLGQWREEVTTYGPCYLPFMHTSGHTTRVCVGWCMCVCDRDTLQILLYNYYHSSEVLFLGTYHCNGYVLLVST